MIDDYRCTRYCPKLNKISQDKNKVKQAVLKDHPRARDLYSYISRNDLSYKTLFVQSYNGKCSYCGVSLEIIPMHMFEIDHFIPRDAKCFTKPSQAGYIENLVLSCYDCNRAKRNLTLPSTDLDKVHPDGLGICDSFVRDDDYYIRISPKMSDNESIKTFYHKLNLGSQTHRIDYLLMNMRGLRKNLEAKNLSFSQLSEAIELLQHKRNLMG